MGNWMAPIAEDHLKKLRIRAPGYPEDWFRCAVSEYINACTNKPPTHAAARDQLQSIIAKADELAVLIASNRELLDEHIAAGMMTHPDAAVRRESAKTGHSKELADQLSHFVGLVELARRRAEEQSAVGRDLAENTALVSNLVRGLRRAGLEVTAGANGPLVQAFSIALEAANKNVANHADTVRKALRSIARNQ